MTALTHTQNEELRHAALEVLAVRHPTAHPLHAVRRRIDKDHLIEFRYDDEVPHLLTAGQAAAIVDALLAWATIHIDDQDA